MATLSSRPKPNASPFFASPTHLLGWQGLTATLPENWNLASFGGGAEAGNLRVDDEDGPRLEIRWEQPKNSVDLDKSLRSFLEQLEKRARKEKKNFELVPDARVVSKHRKRKEHLQSFGWVGEEEDIAGQGWGVLWKCADCGRVVLSHVIGRGTENPDKIKRLANEILSSLECHGQGGWQTWSLFDLQLDVPIEFELERAKLLTGRIELEWLRPNAPSVFDVLGWAPPPQRLAVWRFAPANVLLESETLDEWTQRVVTRPDKKRIFGPFAPIEVRGHEGVIVKGRPRDLRRRVRGWIRDVVTRKPLPVPEVRVWACESSNKIFALDTHLKPANEHVTQDVLDSLSCH